MKKIICIFVCLTCLAYFCSCKENKTVSAKTWNAEESTEISDNSGNGELADQNSKLNYENSSKYSEFLNDNGFYDLKISDYIKLPKYIGITFPDNVIASNEVEVLTTMSNLTSSYTDDGSSPDLTDEFVDEYFGNSWDVHSIDELHDYLTREYLRQDKLDYIDEYLVENSIISSIPEDVIQHQTAILEQNLYDTASDYGISVDSMLEYMGYDSFESLVAASEDTLKDLAKDAAVYQAIAEIEGISVNYDDITGYFKTTNELEVMDEYIEKYGVPYLKSMILTYKIRDYIISEALN